MHEDMDSLLAGSDGRGSRDARQPSGPARWVQRLPAPLRRAVYAGWRMSVAIRRRDSHVYAVALLCTIAALVAADQNLMAPNLTQIAHDLGMDDRERDAKLAGQTSAAFFLVGAPASVVAGYIDPYVNRVAALLSVVILGEGPLVLTLFVTRFWQLFLLRVLTGIAVGGSFPLVYSILSDLFPSSRRNFVSSLIILASGIGVAVGQGLAGTVGPALGWRVPFVMVGAPSILVAALMLATFRDPPRGAKDVSGTDAPPVNGPGHGHAPRAATGAAPHWPGPAPPTRRPHGAWRRGRRPWEESDADIVNGPSLATQLSFAVKGPFGTNPANFTPVAGLMPLVGHSSASGVGREVGSEPESPWGGFWVGAEGGAPRSSSGGGAGGARKGAGWGAGTSAEGVPPFSDVVIETPARVMGNTHTSGGHLTPLNWRERVGVGGGGDGASGTGGVELREGVGGGGGDRVDKPPSMAVGKDRVGLVGVSGGPVGLGGGVRNASVGIGGAELRMGANGAGEGPVEALRGALRGAGEMGWAVGWERVKSTLRVPSNVLVCLQGVPGSLPWGMMMVFMNDYLAQDQGLGVMRATGIMLCFGIGGGLGILGGGAVGQALYNKKEEWMVWFFATGVLMGIFPTLYLILADLPRQPPVLPETLALAAGAITSLAGPNVRAVTMNVNSPYTRGLALALHATMDDLGRGLGPALVAPMVLTMGRRGAFVVATMGWVPCAAIMLGLAWTVRGDEGRWRREWARHPPSRRLWWKWRPQRRGKSRKGHRAVVITINIASCYSVLPTSWYCLRSLSSPVCPVSRDIIVGLMTMNWLGSGQCMHIGQRCSIQRILCHGNRHPAWINTISTTPSVTTHHHRPHPLSLYPNARPTRPPLLCLHIDLFRTQSLPFIHTLASPITLSLIPTTPPLPATLTPITARPRRRPVA